MGSNMMLSMFVVPDAQIENSYSLTRNNSSPTKIIHLWSAILKNNNIVIPLKANLGWYSQ